MSESITPEVFQHLVQLAALELTPQEGEYLRRELNNQLKSIHELAAIPLEGDTPITSHGVPYTLATTPAIREDIWQADPAVAAILKQAPKLEDGYIVVPEIPHTELK